MPFQPLRGVDCRERQRLLVIQDRLAPPVAPFRRLDAEVRQQALQFFVAGGDLPQRVQVVQPVWPVVVLLPQQRLVVGQQEVEHSTDVRAGGCTAQDVTEATEPISGRPGR